MRKLMGVVGVSALLSMTSIALAEDTNVVREADQLKYKKKTVIDFSDVTIQGELTKPEGSYLLNRKKTNFRSLLKKRANFIPELERSTDNL